MGYKLRVSGIYIIEIGDYYYIGKSVDIFNRWSSHHKDLFLKQHHSPKLQEKYNELGLHMATFRVLEYISMGSYKNLSGLKGKSLKSAFNKYLLLKEKQWMSKHSKNYCLNKFDKWFAE